MLELLGGILQVNTTVNMGPRAEAILMAAEDKLVFVQPDGRHLQPMDAYAAALT